MKKEQFKETIGDYANAGNPLYGFYVTYGSSEHVLSQMWGRIERLDSALDEIAKSEYCVDGELPIVRLIVYSGREWNWQCLVFAPNPLWNGVDYESGQSHIVLTVPYISDEGEFGKIVTE